MERDERDMRDRRDDGARRGNPVVPRDAEFREVSCAWSKGNFAPIKKGLSRAIRVSLHTPFDV